MTDPDGTDLSPTGERLVPPGGSAPGPPSGGDRIAVLHVDADPEFLERAAVALGTEDDRLDVLTETDADAAEECLTEVDCVVSDHRPPGIDGLALLSAIRERSPDLPFVLFTAEGSESLAREVLSASNADYLRKDNPEALTVLADRVVTAVERHRTRRALVRQTDLFERTQRLASVGGWEYDLRTETLRWTDEVRRILGVDEDYDPNVESVIEFYHPDDRPKIRDAFRAAAETGESFDLELRLRTADGDRKWVRARGGRRAGDRETALVRGSFQDVTDRKRQERRLRGSKATIEALHRAAPEIAAAADPESVAQRTVDAAEILFDFRMCSVLLYEDGWLEPVAMSEGAPPDGARAIPVDGEGEGGLAGKTYRTGESFVIDLIDPDDDTDPARDDYRSGISVPVGDHGVFQAVSTESEGFDDEDIELAELLVAYAASALDRLDRERELRRQNERLDQFARVVSHDLRNPMEVIQAEVSLARETGDLSRLDRVEDGIERMDRIIEDLLTLGRAGQRVGDLLSVGLEAVVRETWATVATGSAELRVDLPEGYTVEADRSRLRQALANLFRNSVEHGSTGPRAEPGDGVEHAGEAVAVRVGTTDNGFFVEDTGPGIDPGEREAVFDPGYTTDDDGTGLGLAIVRGIIEAHGWTVAVTEGSDGGARFEITTGDGE